MLQANPPVSDIALFGVPCRTLLAPCTCGAEGAQCRGVFFDLRPIQEGIRFVCCARPCIDLAPILAAFDAGAPFGWQSQVRFEGHEGEQYPDLHPGMPLVVDYVPRVSDDGHPTRVPVTVPIDEGLETPESPGQSDAASPAGGTNVPIEQYPQGSTSSYGAAVAGGSLPDQTAAPSCGGLPLQEPLPGDGEEGDGDAPGGSHAPHHVSRPAAEHQAQPLSFLLFSLEYKPEGISTGLLTPSRSMLPLRRSNSSVHRQTIEGRPDWFLCFRSPRTCLLRSWPCQAGQPRW